MTIGLEDGTMAAQAVTAIDVAAERSRTAGTAGRHYFNAAGAGLVSDGVLEAVVTHLRREQRVGGYEAANQVADEVAGVYTAAATLLGSAPDEIALFDSATSGLRGVFDALRLGAGDTVVAPRSSYVSQALRLLAMQRHDDVRLEVVPSDATGAMDLEALDRAVAGASGRVVVSAVHVPTSSGLVEPIAEISAVARRHGALTVVDATQSVGQIDIDVRAVDCDALVTTGRKFLRGPRGTGIAYLRRGMLEGVGAWAPDVRGAVWTGEDEWTMDGTARQLETWECSVAARLGLGVALREALDRGPAATEAHLVGLGAHLRTALDAVDGVTVADPSASASAIVTFTVDGVAGKEVSARLRQRRIDSISVPASHAQWDLGARGLPSVVRVSPHVYNDDEDVRVLLEGVADVVAEVRA
ncbi:MULTISPECIES: aminotransferase class V-fold PLP-dependent enzyme [unclassified Curtobacterium]|uniref:aminotransferase class V-fold PLP-dependent enzyme n=1 Tax=Bacteria TaxID=2 RepID=UPI00104FDB08|nr:MULTISPECIES: aminotransferase class V-fold PLP-dependent enzyme [unclassified Curtobacterium]QSB23840.1 aminotransferase class V-fold PLP-dependent enzyme [Curtobacterium sp. 24E2]TCL77145.1 selenocysteine lyase/cysteine desulfurase [Curtobacterium sp. PhB128]TCL88421.1 selenocysteine lyase/cysteine desulfurase [Curtobacterium sp. PhB142]TCL92723.1 selenocysteine lyase/cysteine desulfurase [Curtobacterium sp. PhB138]TCM04216.1 selenocysteine lyase/cysteine desulfurase [Curtobacterium sp. P